MGEFSTSIEIDAAPDVVFEYLVTDAGMTAWMGQWAQLDARPGGSFAVNIAGYSIRGEYLEVDRPHRVVVSWGAAGNPDLPPGTSIVEFSLMPAGSGTRVELTHRALPDVDMPGHADGWAHFLPRLKVAATGGNAGNDTWTPA